MKETQHVYLRKLPFTGKKITVWQRKSNLNEMWWTFEWGVCYGTYQQPEKRDWVD